MEPGEKKLYDHLAELVGVYMDLNQKQDAALYHLSQVVQAQEKELARYRQLLGYQDMGTPDTDKTAAEAALADLRAAEKECGDL